MQISLEIAWHLATRGLQSWAALSEGLLCCCAYCTDQETKGQRARQFACSIQWLRPTVGQLFKKTLQLSTSVQIAKPKLQCKINNRKHNDQLEYGIRHRCGEMKVKVERDKIAK